MREKTYLVYTNPSTNHPPSPCGTVDQSLNNFCFPCRVDRPIHPSTVGDIHQDLPQIARAMKSGVDAVGRPVRVGQFEAPGRSINRNDLAWSSVGEKFQSHDGRYARGCHADDGEYIGRWRRWLEGVQRGCAIRDKNGSPSA